MKQYLLNPDGSFPPNIDPKRLVELGITPVLPTPRHVPAEGMVLQEGEPVQGEDGMWRQVWNEVPAPPPEQPSPEEVLAAFTAAIQERLDAFARTRNYDGILSACTYATSAVAQFAAEGQRCVDLRDQTWLAAYGILAQVQAGARPMPMSLADIDADLPAQTWP